MFVKVLWVSSLFLAKGSR